MITSIMKYVVGCFINPININKGNRIIITSIHKFHERAKVNCHVCWVKHVQVYTIKQVISKYCSHRH